MSTVVPKLDSVPPEVLSFAISGLNQRAARLGGPVVTPNEFKSMMTQTFETGSPHGAEGVSDLTMSRVIDEVLSIQFVIDNEDDDEDEDYYYDDDDEFYDDEFDGPAGAGDVQRRMRHEKARKLLESGNGSLVER